MPRAIAHLKKKTVQILSPYFALSLPGGAEIIMILVALAILFIWIKTIMEIARSRFTDDTYKIVWLLVVILCGVVGMIIYYAVGRKNRIAG